MTLAALLVGNGTLKGKRFLSNAWRQMDRHERKYVQAFAIAVAGGFIGMPLAVTGAMGYQWYDPNQSEQYSDIMWKECKTGHQARSGKPTVRAFSCLQAVGGSVGEFVAAQTGPG